MIKTHKGIGIQDIHGTEVWVGATVRLLQNPGFSTYNRVNELCIVVQREGYYALEDKRGVSWPIGGEKFELVQAE